MSPSKPWKFIERVWPNCGGVGVVVSSSSRIASDRLPVVHTLRGLASLAVCWFHFASAGNLNTGVVGHVAQYGSLGVPMFFVISGFVLPYSLWKGSYRLKLYGTYILKRVVRLDPPYIAAIIVSVGLGYGSSALSLTSSGQYHVTWVQLLCHLGYLNVLFKNDWVNPVFWTLAIEFQYYVILGLVFPVISSPSTLSYYSIAVSALALSFVVSSVGLIPRYAALFLLGICVFRRRTGVASATETGLATVMFTVFAGVTLGIPTAIVALMTALSIMVVEVRSRVSDWLGDISYSLYLVHSPLGSRICNVAARFHPTVVLSNLIVVGVMVFVLGAAYVLYRSVERPSQRIAARLSYRRERSYDV